MVGASIEEVRESDGRLRKADPRSRDTPLCGTGEGDRRRGSGAGGGSSASSPLEVPGSESAGALRLWLLEVGRMREKKVPKALAAPPAPLPSSASKEPVMVRWMSRPTVLPIVGECGRGLVDLADGVGGVLRNSAAPAESVLVCARRDACCDRGEGSSSGAVRAWMRATSSSMSGLSGSTSPVLRRRPCSTRGLTGSPALNGWGSGGSAAGGETCPCLKPRDELRRPRDCSDGREDLRLREGPGCAKGRGSASCASVRPRSLSLSAVSLSFLGARDDRRGAS
mmetsp:Transcript_1989/g.6906  ORF Transcript_1989/g.6906 Transcript_1989/m.6906 type:complete len:282 (-) Transcript_1989:504-1349(-)